MAGMPDFLRFNARHKDNMKNIAFWQAKQLDALSLHGLVQDKNLLRALITFTDDRVKAGILALAISINDNTLASKVQFPTSLQSMSDSGFLASSKKVKQVADENALKLIPMGITTQVLNDMELDLTAFEKIIKKPKALRGQVTVYTKNLNDAVKTMFNFLRTSVTCQVKSLYPRTDFADAFKANSKECRGCFSFAKATEDEIKIRLTEKRGSLEFLSPGGLVFIVST
jgi:hypothetical protein